MIKGLHRLRVKFYRFKLRKKGLFLWGVLSVLILLVVLPASVQFWVTTNGAFPLLSDGIDEYVEFRISEDSIELAQPLALLLSETFALDDEHIFISLISMMATKPSSVGLLKKDNKVFGFARNPTESVDQNLSEEFDLKLSKHEISGQEFIIISEHEWPEDKITRSLETRRNIFRLILLSNNATGVLLKDSIYGQFRGDLDRVVLELSPHRGLISTGLYEGTQPGGSLYIENSQSFPDILWPSFFPEREEGLIGFADHIFKYPGKINLVSGRPDQFFINPYQLELGWEISLDIDRAGAAYLMNVVLDDLTRLYPESVERVLPDDTIVFELMQSKENFIEGGEIDFEKNSAGDLTYLRGQLIYSYSEENGLSISKRLDEMDKPTVDNSCLFDDFLMAGNFKYHDESDLLWKRLFFGLDQQRMILCIDKK